MEQEALARWFREALKSLPRHSGKSQKELARILRVPQSAISALKAGRRRFSAHEVPVIAKYLGVDPPPGFASRPEPNSGDTMSTVRPVEPQRGGVFQRLIVGKAIIAPGVWREGGHSMDAARRVPADPSQKLVGLEQYWVSFEEDPNRFAICVPYFRIRQRPLQGDEVHVVRERGGQKEHTIRKVVIQGDRTELHCVTITRASSRPVVTFPSSDELETVTMEGLVVGEYFAREI